MTCFRIKSFLTFGFYNFNYTLLIIFIFICRLKKKIVISKEEEEEKRKTLKTNADHYQWRHHRHVMYEQDIIEIEQSMTAVQHSFEQISENHVLFNMLTSKTEESKETYWENIENLFSMTMTSIGYTNYYKYWVDNYPSSTDPYSSDEDEGFTIPLFNDRVVRELLPLIKCYNFIICQELLLVLNYPSEATSHLSLTEIEDKKFKLVKEMEMLEKYNIEVHKSQHLLLQARHRQREINGHVKSNDNKAMKKLIQDEFAEFLPNIVDINFIGPNDPMTDGEDDLYLAVAIHYHSVLGQLLETKIHKPSDWYKERKNYKNMSHKEKSDFNINWQKQNEDLINQAKNLYDFQRYPHIKVQEHIRDYIPPNFEVIVNHVFNPKNTVLHDLMILRTRNEKEFQSYQKKTLKAEMFFILENTLRGNTLCYNGVYGLLNEDITSISNQQRVASPLIEQDNFIILDPAERKLHDELLERKRNGEDLSKDDTARTQLEKWLTEMPQRIETWTDTIDQEEQVMAEQAIRAKVINDHLNHLHKTILQRSNLVEGYWALSEGDIEAINLDVLTQAHHCNLTLLHYQEGWVLSMTNKNLRLKFSKYLHRKYSNTGYPQIEDLVNFPCQIKTIAEIQPFKVKRIIEQQKILTSKQKTRKMRSKSVTPPRSTTPQPSTSPDVTVSTTPQPSKSPDVTVSTTPQSSPDYTVSPRGREVRAMMARDQLRNKIDEMRTYEDQWTEQTDSISMNPKEAGLIKIKDLMKVTVQRMLEHKETLVDTVDPEVTECKLTEAIPSSVLVKYVQAENSIMELISLGDPDTIPDEEAKNHRVHLVSLQQKREILETLVDDRRKRKEILINNYIMSRILAKKELFKELKKGTFKPRNESDSSLVKCYPKIKDHIEDYYKEIRRTSSPDDLNQSFRTENNALNAVREVIDEEIHILMAVIERTKDAQGSQPSDNSHKQPATSPPGTAIRSDKKNGQKDKKPNPKAKVDLSGLNLQTKKGSPKKPDVSKVKTPPKTQDMKSKSQPQPAKSTPEGISRQVTLPTHPTDANPKIYGKKFEPTWATNPPSTIVKKIDFLQSAQHRTGTATLVDWDGELCLAYCKGNGQMNLFTTNIDFEMNDEEAKKIAETAKDSITRYIRGEVTTVIFLYFYIIFIFTFFFYCKLKTKNYFYKKHLSHHF